MNQHTPTGSSEARSGISWVTWRVVVRFLFTTVFMLAILFLAAGRLDWWVAWAYAAVALIVLILSRALMLLRNPDLARERAEAGDRENVKPWDKVLVPLVAVYGPLVSWIVAGLDFRFGWSPRFPLALQLGALAVLTLGSAFGTWAMIVNRFFSSHVRIQEDRGHVVVSTGPYRIVRHPAYAGVVLSWAAAPLFFGSLWVAIPTVLVIAATILRTALEDRTLRDELPGYEDYAQRVRHRLVPGIW